MACLKGLTALLILSFAALYAQGAGALKYDASTSGVLHLRNEFNPDTEANIFEVNGDAKEYAGWLVKSAQDGQKPLASDEFILGNTLLALKARREVKAAEHVNEELFKRWVLPYRNLDEPIEDWRSVLFQKLLPIAKGKATLRDVADAVIPYTFKHLGSHEVKFQPNNTPQIMAPISETLTKAYASCTGLSILITDALRAVGVPARVVGTAQWNIATGGNHNWVEAYFEDGWHFTDAQEVPEWDKAWFTAGNVQKAERGTIHGIYTAVWDAEDANGQYSLGWREPAKVVAALELTDAYKNLAEAAWDPKWEEAKQGSEGVR